MRNKQNGSFMQIINTIWSDPERLAAVESDLISKLSKPDHAARGGYQAPGYLSFPSFQPLSANYTTEQNPKNFTRAADIIPLLKQCCGSEIINFGSGSGSYFPVNFGSGSGSAFQIISDPDPTFYLFSDPDPDPFRILFGSNIFSDLKKKFTFFQVFSSSIVNSF